MLLSRLTAQNHYLFLAAMSSSRSDVVRPCFRPFFFLSVSLKFLLVLKGFSGVSRLKGVSGSFKGISRVFERSSTGVSESFKGGSMKFPRSFKEI